MTTVKGQVFPFQAGRDPQPAGQGRTLHQALAVLPQGTPWEPESLGRCRWFPWLPSVLPAHPPTGLTQVLFWVLQGGKLSSRGTG